MFGEAAAKDQQALMLYFEAIPGYHESYGLIVFCKWNSYCSARAWLE
jgi:hypothetical protein